MGSRMRPVGPHEWREIYDEQADRCGSSDCVKKIGSTGVSISVEISPKRLLVARRKVFLEIPEKYRCFIRLTIDLHSIAPMP